jgi:hypothetical protein
MTNRRVLRGLFLIAIALFFGLQALAYPLGSFSRAGPGMFPLLVSGILGLIGVFMLVRSRFEQAEPMTFNYRNISIVMASLIGFALIAEHFKMIPAIVYLVFVSTLAGSSFSVVRNLKICAVLIAIAFALRQFLGLQLPLL